MRRDRQVIDTRKGVMARSGWMSVVGIALLTLSGVSADAATRSAGQEPSVDQAPVTQTSTASRGRIIGVVTDATGMPLDGALISAFGPSGAELAMADADGRFMLRSLTPGAYLVQAHLPGFAASRRELVAVSTSAPAVYAIALSRVGPAAEPMTASVGLPRRTDVDGQGQETDATRPESAAIGASAPHDHSEKAWRLRRARRSVLKEDETRVTVDAPASVAEAGAGTIAMLTRPLESPVRFAASLLEQPLTGELNLLTRGTLDSAADVLTGAALPAGIANLSVGAPVWRGEWSARGAMTTGDVSSWVVSGAYVADVEASHRLGLDVSYGKQRYEVGNPAALTATYEGRYAASFGVSDSWAVSPRVTVDYGGRYATYGYIEEDGLFSPRVAVTVTPLPAVRVRIAGSLESVAPGAGEFLPPTQTGLWLPPERTFAAFSSPGDLHPERARLLDVGLEYDLTDGYVFGVRRFYQDVTDQMVTLFGVDGQGAAPTGHYYLARAGSVTNRGWLLTLRRQLGDRFSGSVDYSTTEAHWRQAGADAALGAAVPGAIRPNMERFHDLSGAVETEIPGTNTLVFVRCRVNTAFVLADNENHSGVDARFDVRVNQVLPFSPFEGSRWEALVVVRSLFFEPQDTISMFDELLVVSPPTEIVGGLVVHF